MNYHPEKIPSAIERYQKETIRVLGVLESVLSKQDWLVGGKCTIADLSFITYAVVSIFRSCSLTGEYVSGGTKPLSSTLSRTTLASTLRRTSRPSPNDHPPRLSKWPGIDAHSS